MRMSKQGVLKGLTAAQGIAIRAFRAIIATTAWCADGFPQVTCWSKASQRASFIRVHSHRDVLRPEDNAWLVDLQKIGCQVMVSSCGLAVLHALLMCSLTQGALQILELAHKR